MSKLQRMREAYRADVDENQIPTKEFTGDIWDEVRFQRERGYWDGLMDARKLLEEEDDE